MPRTIGPEVYPKLKYRGGNIVIYHCTSILAQPYHIWYEYLMQDIY